MSKRPEYPRYKYGLSMAFLTLASWSVIPILVKFVLAEVSPQALGLFRLSFASLCIWAWLRHRELLSKARLSSILPLCVMAGLAFSLHYYLLFQSIALSGPALAQVLVQSGAMGLALCGPLLFAERLSARQLSGVVLTICGMFFFQADLHRSALDSGIHMRAAIYAFSAGLCWIIYGVVQKHLSRTYHSLEILLLVFASAALAHLICTDVSEYFALSELNMLILVLLGVLTVSGYWCFAEALKFAPAAQVSMVAALGPLVTLALLELLSSLLAIDLSREKVSAYGYLAALLAVLGLVLLLRRAPDKAADIN